MNRESTSASPGLRFWAALIGVSAAIGTVSAGMVGAEWLHYVFKPLTTLLVAALVLRAPQALASYRKAVLAGLLLSTLGDVFLMLPQDRFVFGLGSFLLAHLAYLFAFTRHRAFSVWRWPFLAYALLAGGVLAVLWPVLPDPLRIPVLIYVIALAAMAAQASAVAVARAHAGALFAAIGGLSFVASDALLAFDRFHTPLEFGRYGVLASYWLAQFLIGRSVWYSSR
jgi:uncharacterized membrane protein YhhN